MNVIYEGKRSILLAGQASIIEDGRELAWAEKHIKADRDLKWILGNYVMADVANDNGHIFPLEDLKSSHLTIENKPLNLLHQPHRIVGHYVSAEMLFPVGEGDSTRVEVPYVEALSVFYQYYFQDEWAAIQEAHSGGALFYSMEAVPKSLVCSAVGCGLEFAYEGRQHSSYCDHLKESPVAARRLVEPHFTGGALIVPPARPGWKNADIKELSRLFDEAETAYEAAKTLAPHLEVTQWESLMVALMEQAGSPLTVRKN